MIHKLVLCLGDGSFYVLISGLRIVMLVFMLVLMMLVGG